MDHEATASQLHKALPERACAFIRCRRIFTPKAQHQLYCSDTHRALAYQHRKLKKAIAAALRKQRREIQAKNAN